MKNVFSIICMVIATFFMSCSSDDDGGDPGGGGGGGGPEALATYRITFNPTFTDVNFPQDYPANPAFSGLVVVVHKPSRAVFGVGEVASAGLKELAETGGASALEIELEAENEEDDVNYIVSSLSTSGGPTQSQSIEVTIDPEKTSITVLSALSPSPDWFVGLDSFSLISGPNSLVQTSTQTLVPLDAGTDSGTTYTSGDMPTSPQEVIATINTAPLGGGGLSSSIGTIFIERTDI